MLPNHFALGAYWPQTATSRMDRRTTRTRRGPVAAADDPKTWSSAATPGTISFGDQNTFFSAGHRQRSRERASFNGAPDGRRGAGVVEARAPTAQMSSAAGRIPVDESTACCRRSLGSESCVEVRPPPGSPGPSPRESPPQRWVTHVNSEAAVGVASTHGGITQQRLRLASRPRLRLSRGILDRPRAAHPEDVQPLTKCTRLLQMGNRRGIQQGLGGNPRPRPSGW